MKKNASKLKTPKRQTTSLVKRLDGQSTIGSKKTKKVVLYAVNGHNDKNTGRLQKSKRVITHSVKVQDGKNAYEFEKSKGVIIVEIIEYVPNAVLSKTIIKKSTGNISIMSLDTGEGLTEKTSPFDTFAQIIDGKAEIVIDGVSNMLVAGEGIILPAHRPNIFRANERFKMILTVIKSGYE
jgi:quercetin dioxygenase-like cupin family protein